MAVGETKEVDSVRRGGGGRARPAAGAVNVTPSLLGWKGGRGLHGFRATKQWVEETAQCRGEKAPNAADSSSSKGAISRAPSRKEGRVQFKQEENEHLTTSKLASPVSSALAAPSLLRKDGLSDATRTAALSPISLNSLPGFSQISTSTLKPVPVPHSSSSNHQTPAPILDIPNTLTDGKQALQQAVPFVRNEGGERKVVWCNPAFCEDSEDRRFSNEFAASAQTTPCPPPPSYPKSLDHGQRQDIPAPQQQQMGRYSIGLEEESSSSIALSSSKINNGATAASSPAFSVSAVAGSPASGAMASTPEDRGRSVRAQLELESASGNWYTPVMASVVTPENVGNSDRLMDFSTRSSRRTPAQLPPFKAGSSPQVFFSSPANHLCTSSAFSPSTREDHRGEYSRPRASSAFNLNRASHTPTSDGGVFDHRRSSRKLLMQPIVDVKAEGPAAPPQTDSEAVVEADLEADITRDIEEEIAKEILYLSQRLAALHARQDMKRAGGGEKSKVGHSCPQTPLRCCAPSPSEPPAAAAAAVPTILEEKQRPASESKRRSGRVVAAKFLQSAAERSRSAQSVDRTRRRLSSDLPFVAQTIHVPRRSLGTPARLLAKLKPSPCDGSPEHQGSNSKSKQSRSKVSADEYARERSSGAAGGGGRSKSALLKEVFREDLEASRNAAAIIRHHEVNNNLERIHQHTRSLSMGSAVQSRYFPEFERKIDWVKTLRSETLPHSTAVSSIGQLIDDSAPKQNCKDTQVIHAWLRENHGSVERGETVSDNTEESEPIRSPSSRSPPVQQCDQSNNGTPQLQRRAIIIQQQARTGPSVAQSPSPSKVARPWTTPTRHTPCSSAAAAARSCSPSVRARTVLSRYGTPVRANSKTPGTSDKCVTDPKLVFESPVRKVDVALRSASKQAGTSSSSKGRDVVRKPTIRKGYPVVTGSMSKGECGDCDMDVHCSRHHHHHSIPAGKARDRNCTGGSNNHNECMKRNNFEAEYEKFVESSEIVEKQVSELYHAAMENVSSAEPSAEQSEAVGSTDDHSWSPTTAPKRTYIRCIDLIKDMPKTPFLLKGKRATGQSVLPPTDGQDSDDSVLARSIPRTESSEQDLDEELLTGERSGQQDEGVEVVEVKLSRAVDDSEPVTSGRVCNPCKVETLLLYEDSLVNERQCLPKIRAKTNVLQQFLHGESPRDSGCVKRISDQHKIHPFSESSRGQPQLQGSDNEGLSPDEIEGLDLESFWCLVGELEGPIMITQP